MTYYEELGISADATDEEIRQAHRRLVKLLHPDQQQDPAIRLMAERQLSRVNRMVGQLLDRAERARYDLSLRHPGFSSAGHDSQILIGGLVGRAVQPLPWKFGAIVLSVASLAAMLFYPGQSIRSVPAPPSVAPLTGGTPASKVQPMPSRIARRPEISTQAGIGDGGISRAQGGDSRETEAPARDVPLNPVASEIPVPPPPAPLPSGSAPLRSETPPTLAGIWLYAGGGGTVSENEKLVYKPEYIEMRVREEAGGTQVRGDYRSRYAVTDLAITPSVQFTFTGDAGSGSWRWQGPKGSSGTLKIRFLHRNAIQVDWKVTELGDSGMGLEFGSATLVRRL